jgi:glycosyltransferase involved in cell wall biosynthesis
VKIGGASRMRVLIIGPSPTKSRGGMATVIDGIVSDKELNQKYDIDMYESYRDGNKFEVICFGIIQIVRFFLTKRNYDIYHIHAATRGSTFRKGIYVKIIKIWNKKVIFHIHGAEYMDFFDEISERGKQEVIHILHQSDMVVALSDGWKKIYDQKFKLQNCVVLENGVDTKHFAKAECNVTEHIKSFAVLGRIGQRKGTYDLIEAIQNVVDVIPDCLCYLAGDGEVENVRKIIREKGLETNIKVLGWVAGEKKLELLQKVATIILPSYHECLPMTILEGMACGKAIISTTVGAIPEVVKEDNGILITAGDIKSLQNAIIKCCTDEKMVKNFSEANSRKMERQFSISSMHTKLALYYDAVYSVG